MEFNFYHQYAQHDFTLLDRRLGTLEELRALTQAAHARGMYILVDVVMNHMGNEFFFEGHSTDTAPFRFHENHGLREYRLIPRRSSRQLYDTPAGKQPYMDFWYNNTWAAEAQYDSPLYGQYGEAAWDQGYGTYEGSDFHHNGDLQNYADPWEINVAKIYGTMDDLRLEHRRVQDKYIAMTEALIASTDVDGFRVDTPMQVPLPFYKRWAPAIRKYAQSVGKERFGIFGEFYVQIERYATMTGRGRDNSMYGQDRFLPGEATLKGGIVYPYYWYTFTAFVYKQTEFVNGFALAYREENQMIDTWDPTTNRTEYAQWIFCNNHDNWRLQTLTGRQQLYVCLTVITFWPGLPLHYAGDEQDLDTPGSALDGWAREELSASLAWSAVKTSPEGNPAEKDNFDMTAPSYRHISRLNALRRAYFGEMGSSACDDVRTPVPELQDLLIFWRGCTPEGRVMVIANFHAEDDIRTAAFYSPWDEGTKLVDARNETSTLEVTVQGSGFVSLQLAALEVVALVPGPVRSVPPVVLEVMPKHGAVLEASDNATALRVRFDRPMESAAAALVKLDGAQVFSCTDATCQELTAEMPLSEGFHQVTVERASSRDGQQMFSSFQSSFVVRKPRDQRIPWKSGPPNGRSVIATVKWPCLEDISKDPDVLPRDLELEQALARVLREGSGARWARGHALLGALCHFWRPQNRSCAAYRIRIALRLNHHDEVALLAAAAMEADSMPRVFSCPRCKESRLKKVPHSMTSMESMVWRSLNGTEARRMRRQRLLPLLRAAVQRFPRHGEAKGALAMQLGATKMALELWRQAMDLAPTSRAMVNRAVTQLRFLGRRHLAEQFTQRAADLQLWREVPINGLTSTGPLCRWLPFQARRWIRGCRPRRRPSSGARRSSGRSCCGRGPSCCTSPASRPARRRRSAARRTAGSFRRTSASRGSGRRVSSTPSWEAAQRRRPRPAESSRRCWWLPACR
ncbi:unnamed protein product [Effrenium voratum]|nr:unnamed protein product [Effrenium voratum]